MSRKRAFVLFALLVATIALSLTLARRLSTPAGTVAERESLTTDTDSKQLQTSAERVAFLGRYLKLRTQVRDAAFHIVYHDNSHGLPGPSDWSILAAVAVTPADGPAWLSEAQPLGANDAAKARLAAESRRVIPSEWGVSSTGESYIRDGALLVWHPEGVLEFAAATD